MKKNIFLSLLIILGLCGCGEKESFLQSKEMDNFFEEILEVEQPKENNVEITEKEETIEVAETEEEKLIRKRAELEEKVEKLFNSPDDEYDNLYASDHEYYEMINLRKIRDSKAYDSVFAEEKVTLDDIRKVCEANKDIPPKYKDFICDYVERWLELYPGSDFRVLYHNLKTLKIKESSKQEIMMASVAVDAAACYLRSENAIYVRKDIDISKGTQGYIILTHELTHAARTSSYTNEDGDDIKIAYFDDYQFGTYTEEAVITVLAYEIQGIGDEGNVFYMLPYNYFKIILECIDYSGTEYMNHSVNVLADAMDEYMGEDNNARYMLSIYEAETSEHYTSYMDNVYDEEYFGLFHDYVTRMYMKKYLNKEMTMDEAELVYQQFINRITANFELAKSEQVVTEEDFRPSFEKCCEELGIE